MSSVIIKILFSFSSLLFSPHSVSHPPMSPPWSAAEIAWLMSLDPGHPAPDHAMKEFSGDKHGMEPGQFQFNEFSITSVETQVLPIKSLWSLQFLPASSYRIWMSLLVFREYRVCVSPPCPMSHSINTISVNWADKLCAKHRLGYQYGQWQSFVR